MTKTTKNKEPKARNFIKEVGSSLVELYQLIVTIAQFMAAYALWFQDSPVLKVIAGVLAFNAIYIAVLKYTKK